MDGVRIVPLGGLGEIGRNCLVLEQGDASLMIDCGVSFPTADYGVGLYHPRFDHVCARGDALAGVVLTHGHEDHVGALPYLAQALDRKLSVWGPPHALRVAEGRLAEVLRLPPGARVRERVALQPIAPGEPFDVGPFRVEAIQVTHSIPQATALCIDTAVGRVVHSGDFKLDPDPLDGRLTDEARLEAIGREGVALLMSDSTNALREGHTGSERVAAQAIDRQVASARQRVVVSIFSSNVQRMGAVADAARAHGRKLCLLGRSMRMHCDIARDLGLLSWPSDLVVMPEIAAKLPRERVLFIASGTQGEPRGALRRLASATHSDVRLEEGDMVILSSRVIPGNERAVFAMIDDLLGFGVEVRWSATDPDLHVSGHACRDEQRRMIELVQPRAFLPLHGTRAHLQRHAALARELGVASVLELLDGQVAGLDRTGRLRVVGAAMAGPVAVARDVVLSDEVIRQRRQLARSGVIFVAVGQDQVAVAIRGLPEDRDIVEEVRVVARRAMGGKGGRDKICEAVRVAVRHRAHELLDDKPPVEVVWMGGPAGKTGP